MIYYIHIEKIWNNEVWNNLLDFIKTHKCHLFLMPPQIYYQWSVLGYRGTERELETILAERYKQLLSLKEKYNFEVGIHIHFSLHPRELSEEEKRDTLLRSLQWMSQFFIIKSIVFGWYKYDDFLKKLCEKYNLKIYNKGLHDYDLPLTFKKKAENYTKDSLRKLLK